jgi:MinD-like ATPase involved in chromosome partitioning or flagellar assembly
VKLGLLANDIELKESFEKLGIFTEVHMFKSLFAYDKYDVLIISDRLVQANELFSKYDKTLPQTVFYMVSNETEISVLNKIITVCKSKDIVCLPPKLSLEQIKDRIIKELFPEMNTSNQNVITLFGADSKVGVTNIAQSLAEMLSIKTELKNGVAVLFLNEQPTQLYFERKEEKGLDMIKTALLSRTLTENDVINAAIKKDKLYLIPGPEFILDFPDFNDVETIDYFIREVAKMFDVVIIDAGHKIDSLLSVAALNSTTNKYLITTQQLSAQISFERVEKQIFPKMGLSVEDFYIVINKCLEYREIYKDEEIANIYKMTFAASFPNLEFKGWQAEFDKKTLVSYENADFNAKFEKFVKLIAEVVGVKLIPDESKSRKGIFKMLSLNR